jgi:hypothetical protein
MKRRRELHRKERADPEDAESLAVPLRGTKDDEAARPMTRGRAAR